jgi:hypothetical protein
MTTKVLDELKCGECVGCGKRVSIHWITCCLRCRKVLCLNCICPSKCFGGAETSTPEEKK